MAHFAELDESNIVLRVLVVPNDQEHRGEEYLASDLNLGGRWMQCSYNGNIRKNYPGIGYTYNPTRDAFIDPKPFVSWVLNDQKCRWEPPVEYPNGEGKRLKWDEQTTSWVEAL